MTFVKTITATTILGFALASTALASDEVSEEAAMKITEMLEADGYEVRKVEHEDGMLEAYAVKDGKLYEIYFDDKFEIVKTKEK